MSSADRERRIEELFHEALELDGDERAAFLDRSCGDDADLRAEIESLLGHRSLAGASFLSDPAFNFNEEGLDDTLFHPAGDEEKEQIGPYRLLKVIGEGGMGQVWLAEQREPLRREVALKIIRIGLNTQDIVARFEAERQALALMNHPCVAKIFDAGTTPSGRPYFVMEYVEGLPINEYCDRRKLSTTDRLELFLQVCEGAQHAHQKAIIHRDLKPSNVLVTEHDGKRIPKIIDFGVAKATAQKLTEKTLVTQLGSLIGTPEYMSPEQADLAGERVDTRTDVYSLGVILYELLIGSLPFEPATLRGAETLEMLRIIREEEPPRPATRIRDLGKDAAPIAKQRLTDPRSLARQLSGELEWITMRTLEKDPARRYSSASELAADVRRYLNMEPVDAGPPSTIYRVRKYARRHRAAVVAASIVLMGLVVGIAGITTGLVRALKAESAAREEALRASREAQTSERVADFLVRLFEVSDPGDARGNSVTAREILDEGAAQVREELGDEPLVQSKLMETMARVYRNLGLYPSALELAEQALESRKRVLAPDDPDIAVGMNLVAQVLEYQGEYEAAEPLYREVLQRRRALHGDLHVDVSSSLNNLAALLKNIGEIEDAEAMYRESLAIDRALPEPDPVGIATTQQNLGLLLSDQGAYEAAEPLFLEAVALLREHRGEEHPDVAIATNNLAILYFSKGDLEAARPLFEDALALNKKLLGDRHPEVGNTMNNLGVLIRRQGDLDAAEPLIREAIEIKRENLGDDHPQVAIGLSGLGNLLTAKGEHQAAVPLFREAVDIMLASLGRDHWMVGQVRSHYGQCLSHVGRHDAAEEQLLEGLEVLTATLGESHQRTQETRKRIAEHYETAGNSAKAQEYRGSESDG